MSIILHDQSSKVIKDISIFFFKNDEKKYFIFVAKKTC